MAAVLLLAHPGTIPPARPGRGPLPRPTTEPAERVRVSRSVEELRQAPYALVPRSLAGPGARRPSTVRPLVAVAAVITGAPHLPGAQALLAFLRSDRARRLLVPCLDAAPEPR